MPIPLKATETDFVLVKPGLYPGLITAITMHEGTTPKGEPSTYLRWTFRLHSGDEVQTNSGMSFGPSSKTRQWAEGALGRKIPDGEVFDVESLVGTWVMAGIGHSEPKKDGKVYNEVQNIYKLENVPQVPPSFYQEARSASTTAPGGVQTLDRATGQWVDDPAPQGPQAPHPADPEAAIFGSNEAPSTAMPTLGQRMKYAIDKLGYQPAQAQQEYRKALTGDAFGSEPIPEFSKASEEEKLKAVTHFEALMAGEIQIEDIPF